MALNKRELKLLMLTITTVMVGVNLFLFPALLARWQKLGRDLNDRRRELTTAEATIAHAPEWRRSYDALGRNLKQAERFATPTDVIKKVDEVVSATGILTQSKQTLKEEERDVYHEWPVQYKFAATVESLVKFLYGLQTSSGFMTVEQLDVTTRSDNSGSLNCVIQIRALTAKEGKPAS